MDNYSDRAQLIDEVKNNYNDHQKYLSYLTFALNKHNIEHYSLKNNNSNINKEHYIISDNKLRITITNILKQKEITFDDFDKILNQLTPGQLSYIGV